MLWRQRFFRLVVLVCSWLFLSLSPAAAQGDPITKIVKVENINPYISLGVLTTTRVNSEENIRTGTRGRGGGGGGGSSSDIMLPYAFRELERRTSGELSVKVRREVVNIRQKYYEETGGRARIMIGEVNYDEVWPVIFRQGYPALPVTGTGI